MHRAAGPAVRCVITKAKGTGSVFMEPFEGCLGGGDYFLSLPRQTFHLDLLFYFISSQESSLSEATLHFKTDVSCVRVCVCADIAQWTAARVISCLLHALFRCVLLTGHPQPWY